MSALLFLDVETVAGSTLGVDHLLVLIIGAVTITVLPFLLLVAFLQRIGTMAKRTLAIGSFLLRETEREE